MSHKIYAALVSVQLAVFAYIAITLLYAAYDVSKEAKTCRNSSCKEVFLIVTDKPITEKLIIDLLEEKEEKRVFQ